MNEIDDYHEFEKSDVSKKCVFDMTEVLSDANVSREQWIQLREICFRYSPEVMEVGKENP